MTNGGQPDPVRRALVSSRAMAVLRMAFRRNRSLRWRALARLGRRRFPSPVRLAAKSLSQWVGWIPAGALLLVGALSAMEPQFSGFSLLCRAVPLLCDETAAVRFLTSLWAVEAGILALVVAVALFALESLVRQRPGVTLREYAVRSGITLYVMVGAAGVLALGLVLIWGPGRPPPAGALAAVVIAGAGLVLLPWFVHHALTVVDPAWFRTARLDDLQAAVRETVNATALRLAARVELEEWVAGRPAEIASRWLADRGDQRTLEASPTTATVFDLDLGRLAHDVEAHPGLRIQVEIDVRARNGESLLTVPIIGESSRDAGPAVVLVAESAGDPLDDAIMALKDEGLEAVRSGSTSGIAEVADAYSEFMLAWPRAWQTYAERLEGGLLQVDQPFGLGPVSRAKGDLAGQLEEAVRLNRRDHVFSLTGVVYQVGSASIVLRASDLLREVCSLSQMYLRFSPVGHDLTQIVEDRSWRHLVELSTFPLERDLEEVSSEEEADAIEQMAVIIFDALAELERSLIQRGSYEEVNTLDGRFRKLFEFSRVEGNVHWARHLLEQAGAGDTSADEAREAQRTVSRHDRQGRLSDYRTSLRMQVLAWMTDRVLEEGPPGLWTHARSYAESMPADDELMRAMKFVGGHDSLLDRWLMTRGPEFEASFVDVQGPALRAFALVMLLKRMGTSSVPPAPWLTRQAADRIAQMTGELLDIDEVRRFALNPGEAREEALAKLTDAVYAAARRQEEIEHAALLDQELDEDKVEAFVSGVVRGWRDSRLIETLSELSALRVELHPPDAFGDVRFGLRPRPEPKGLFVSPTSWVGVESHGEQLGRAIAQGEVTSLVHHIVGRARGVRASGDAPERLRRLLAALGEEGYEPTLIIVPIDWRLWRSLGLSDPGSRGQRLGPHFRGEIEGIPVMDWYDLPDDRIFAADLRVFAHVEEEWDENDRHNPAPPTTEVRPLEDDDLERLLGEVEENDLDRRRRTEASLRVDVYRRFRLLTDDDSAARSVWLPSGLISEDS